MHLSTSIHKAIYHLGILLLSVYFRPLDNAKGAPPMAQRHSSLCTG